jgi:hypothetical protein
VLFSCVGKSLMVSIFLVHFHGIFDVCFGGAMLKNHTFIEFMYGTLCCSFVYAVENGNYHGILYNRTNQMHCLLSLYYN